jgi:hypothetical protein
MNQNKTNDLLKEIDNFFIDIEITKNEEEEQQKKTISAIRNQNPFDLIKKYLDKSTTDDEKKIIKEELNRQILLESSNPMFMVPHMRYNNSLNGPDPIVRNYQVNHQNGADNYQNKETPS